MLAYKNGVHMILILAAIILLFQATNINGFLGRRFNSRVLKHACTQFSAVYITGLKTALLNVLPVGICFHNQAGVY